MKLTVGKIRQHLVGRMITLRAKKRVCEQQNLNRLSNDIEVELQTVESIIEWLDKSL
jgi:hypothetical protein